LVNLYGRGDKYGKERRKETKEKQKKRIYA
jgi:hypothetical protein